MGDPSAAPEVLAALEQPATGRRTNNESANISLARSPDGAHESGGESIARAKVRVCFVWRLAAPTNGTSRQGDVGLAAFRQQFNYSPC